MVKQYKIFLVAILFCFMFLFLYLYQYAEKIQYEIKGKIIKSQCEHFCNVFMHIEKDILKNIKNKNLVASLKNKKTREILESKLTQMISKNTKYVYFLYLDKNGKFRFLLDGSLEDKAHFYQKFDPIKPEIYKNIYKTKEPKIIFQKSIENLWITLLYPVKQKDKVIGILTMDTTTNLQNDIASFIRPLKNFFTVSIIFVSTLIIIEVIQLFKYISTQKQLFYDPLTKLFNRNYLEEIKPTLKMDKYSLAMLDLDKFKIVNDTYGHKAGDLVLKESADIFKNTVRQSDILIRFGGEEFLLFINKRGENDPSIEVCNRIRENIAKHIFNYENDEITITVSMGLHQSPNFEKNLSEAIKKADDMLYLAKQRGRNQVVSFKKDTKNIKTLNRKGIDEVKSALNENRIICYFQPIVDAKKQQIIKYEALVRILSNNKNIIPPKDFMCYIKHTNTHYKLTKKILEICFEKFSHNNKEISINISFLDILNKDITNYIQENLKNNKSLASRITFEILESDEIKDIKVFKEKIEAIHSLGSKIAIDDFGSGYSNFKATLDIEADYLKIDGTLIKEIHKDKKLFYIVKNIIQFAKDSNMKTIAEHVCSKEIYDKLITLNIDYMQGFYLAKPNEKIINNTDIKIFSDT